MFDKGPLFDEEPNIIDGAMFGEEPLFNEAPIFDEEPHDFVAEGCNINLFDDLGVITSMADPTLL